MKKLKYTSALVVCSIVSISSLSASNKTIQHEEIIVRSGESARTAGSANIVGQKDLELFDYQDVNNILRQVPGVEGYNEDGYGLRPNIGFRGGKSERSQGINLMEDGVLIAPAPYASPSAYYFPYMGRAKEVEVLKGAAAIKTGPRTTSGALNIVTKDIEDTAQVKTSVGNHNVKAVIDYALL